MPRPYTPEHHTGQLSMTEHPKTYELAQSAVWPKLPVRLQSALIYSAICGHDNEAPAATKQAMLRWLDSNAAKRLPMLGIKTRAQAMLALA